MTSWIGKVFGNSAYNNGYGIDKKEFKEIAKNFNLTKAEQKQLKDGLKNGNMEDVIKNMRTDDTNFYNNMGLELSSKIGNVDVTQNTAQSKLEAVRLKLEAESNADLNKLLSMSKNHSSVVDNLTDDDYQGIYALLSDNDTAKYLTEKGCDPEKVRNYVTKARFEKAFADSPFIGTLNELSK